MRLEPHSGLPNAPLRHPNRSGLGRGICHDRPALSKQNGPLPTKGDVLPQSGARATGGAHMGGRGESASGIRSGLRSLGRPLPRSLACARNAAISSLPVAEALAAPRPSPSGARVTPLTSRPSGPLTGRIRVPGDKSISHRALMLGALAVGRTHVDGLLEGEDVLRTAAAMRLLGAAVERETS